MVKNVNRLDTLLKKIKDKFEKSNSARQQDIINTINVIILDKHNVIKHPEIDDNKIDFPQDIFIAYAVCHDDCGAKEFIVDGSTQRCHYCGHIMFRGPVKKYILSSK